MFVVAILILTSGLTADTVQGSYEKGILENTLNRVLDKVPILGQRINEIRDSSCGICAKQALRRCPFELLKSKYNASEPKVSYDEIHQVLLPNPNRFTGLVKNIVSAMHAQSLIDLERAKEKEAREKMKKVGEKVVKVADTIDKLIS